MFNVNLLSSRNTAECQGICSSMCQSSTCSWAVSTCHTLGLPCRPVACWGLWQSLPYSFLHKGTHTGRAEADVAPQSCHRWSPGRTLCWETLQTLLQLYVWVFHPEGTGLFVQVLYHATSTDKDTSRTQAGEEPVRKDAKMITSKRFLGSS